VVALGPAAQQRAHAQIGIAVVAAKEVLPLLKKGIAKAKDVQITGGLDLAQAIVTDGLAGAPKPERSKGKLFPHYLVKTKKGQTYKVKLKKVSDKMTITVTKVDAPPAAPSTGK